MVNHNTVVAAQDATTTEWVVRVKSTGVELARFDSAFLAKRMVGTVNGQLNKGGAL